MNARFTTPATVVPESSSGFAEVVHGRSVVRVGPDYSDFQDVAHTVCFAGHISLEELARFVDSRWRRRSKAQQQFGHLVGAVSGTATNDVLFWSVVGKGHDGQHRTCWSTLRRIVRRSNGVALFFSGSHRGLALPRHLFSSAEAWAGFLSLLP